MFTARAKAPLSVKLEKLKAKEELLRLEIRESRKLILSVLRWGVAVLAGLESTLFIRWDVTDHLEGIAFLTIVAFMFCRLADHAVRRHIEYRKQLIDLKPSYSGITEKGLTSGTMHSWHTYFFYAFPFFDALWLYSQVANPFK